MLEAGAGAREIAAALGISAATVCYHKRKLGYPMGKRHRYDWGAVQAYYDMGHSVRACQRRFGFSRKSWHDAANRGAIVPRPQAMPLTDLLVDDKLRSRNNIKKRLVAQGLKKTECEQCGLGEWRGAALSLALHHVNGDGTDNRLENLVLLCPNCHSQTPNFGVKNAGRGRFAGAATRSS